jgi:curved DNA-binding protein CbpA
LENYYDLFGLEQTCSLEDIKSSFRNKVKKLHPDLSGDPGGVEKFRRILAAYKVLSDADKRADYDRGLQFFRHVDSFVYRDFLEKRRDDNVSQAKLIFYDLLHDNGDDALFVYEMLLLREEFQLELFMDREDFMDCAFLLAEEYEKRGRFEKAFDLLTVIARFEMQKPYFRHFFEDVLIRLRALANAKLGRVLRPGDLLDRFFAIVELGLPGKEAAFYTKKIAQAYLALGRTDLAGDYFEKSAWYLGRAKKYAE